MARVKNKHGLTHQQELFCQYVVDAYGNNPKGILVEAYRRAYNCRNDAQSSTHYSNASRLMDNSKIKARIEQLQEQQARLATISRERIISDDVALLDIDPLDLWIQDEKSGKWRMRFLNEIPKRIRKLIKFVRVGKNIIPDIDKDAARKRLIDVLGFASARELNVNSNSSVIGEICIGFDDDEE